MESVIQRLPHDINECAWEKNQNRQKGIMGRKESFNRF